MCAKDKSDLMIFYFWQLYVLISSNPDNEKGRVENKEHANWGGGGSTWGGLGSRRNYRNSILKQSHKARCLVDQSKEIPWNKKIKMSL